LALLVATILLFGCLDQIGSPPSNQQGNVTNAMSQVSGNEIVKNETVKNTSVAPLIAQPQVTMPVEKKLSQGQTIQVGNSSIMLSDLQSSPDGLNYAILTVLDDKGNAAGYLKIKKLNSTAVSIDNKAYEVKCLDVYIGQTLSGMWAEIAVNETNKKPANEVGTVLISGGTMALDDLSVRFAGFNNVPPFSAKLELIDGNGKVLSTRFADEGQNAVFVANGRMYTVHVVQAARGAAMSAMWIRITATSTVSS